MILPTDRYHWTTNAKWIALALMIVSHVGDVLGHWQPWAWLAGRPCLPLFAAMVGINAAVRTRSPARFATRLALWGLVSQLPFWACGYPGLNVLLTLAAAAAVASRPSRLITCLVVGLAIIETSQGSRWTDGGAAAVAIAIGAAEHARGNAAKGWALILAGSAMVTWLHPLGMGAAAIALPIVALCQRMKWAPMPIGPKWAWYAAYPGHLAILAALRYLA